MLNSINIRHFGHLYAEISKFIKKSINYLAHAYLSFLNPSVLVGNMISDFVKGRAKFSYPAQVQIGISLHRDIDGFTDSHPATKAAKDFFRSHYRLYSGAITDVIYDHFLALDSEAFSSITLFDFTQWVYTNLDANKNLFPAAFAQMFPFMKKDNWLWHYQKEEGINKSLWGLAHRARYMGNADMAFRLFLENYQPLKDCYRQLWQDLLPFAKARYQELLNS